MPTHWCLVTSPDNVAKTRALDFTVQGIKKGHRKKAEKMQPGDRIVLYATGRQAFAFTATITSAYYEDHTPIWTSDKPGEDYPFRFSIKPDVVLDEEDYVPVRPIITYENPRLRKKSVKIKRIDADLQSLIDDMIDTMRAAEGIGLAAPQVGVLLRVIVAEYTDEETDEVHQTVLINPEI